MRRGVKYIVSIFLFVCVLLSANMTSYAADMHTGNTFITFASPAIMEGNTTTARVSTYATDAEYTVTWLVEDESIATIDQNGTITGVKEGTTTIYAQVNGSNSFVLEKEFTVRGWVVTYISLNTEKVIITEGDTFQLKATVSPANVNTKPLSWSSSHEDVATVDKNGLITAKKAGSTYIRVQATDTEARYKDCLVYVVPKSQPNSGVQLYKNDKLVGTYSTINKAFDKMTDKNGAYTVRIYLNQRLSGYAQWPTVKSIEIIPRIRTEDLFNSTYLYISEKNTTFNSDVTFSDGLAVVPYTTTPATYYMNLQGYTMTITDEIFGHTLYFGWADFGGFHVSGSAGSKIVDHGNAQFICSSVDVETVEVAPRSPVQESVTTLHFDHLEKDCHIKNLILDGIFVTDAIYGEKAKFTIDNVSNTTQLRVRNRGNVDIAIKKVPVEATLIFEYTTVSALETGSCSYTGKTVPKSICVENSFNLVDLQVSIPEGEAFMPVAANRALLYAPYVPEEIISFEGSRWSKFSIDEYNTCDVEAVTYEGTIKSESGYYYSKNIPTITPSKSVILAAGDTSGTIKFTNVNKNGDFVRVEWTAQTRNLTTGESLDTTAKIIGASNASSLSYTYKGYNSNYLTYLIGKFVYKNAVVELRIPIVYTAKASNVSCAEPTKRVVLSGKRQSITLNYTKSANTKMVVTTTNPKVVDIDEIRDNKLYFYTLSPGKATLRVYIGNKVTECTVTVLSELKSYQIQYNLNGGTNNKSNPAKYYNTSTTITLKNPTKKGYTFKGWYSDAAFKTKVTKIAVGSTGTKKLYAKWTAHKYTIKFSGNGSKSGTMKSLTSRKYGTSYTLPANTYKKTGYTFVGWNTRADGKGTTYKNKASIKNLTATDGKTVTLYAKWQKTKYTITYVLNGGKNDKDNPSKYYITTATIKLDKPTRKGYTFKGWYSDSKFKKSVTKISKGSTGNKKFYAKWKANDYNIRFKGNGATSGSMSKMTNRKYGITYTLKSNAFKKKGYVFVGWNTRADGKGTSYKNKAKIKNLSAKDGETITLYAQWKKKK